MRNIKTNAGERELAEVIELLRKSAGDRKSFSLLMHDLFTANELNELAVRLQILKLLTEGVPHRTIAKKLNVSIATIARGARVLDNGGGVRSLIAQNWWRAGSQRTSAA